jgi:hypothetical protein
MSNNGTGKIDSKKLGVIMMIDPLKAFYRQILNISSKEAVLWN